jgi:hypothetical protein
MKGNHKTYLSRFLKISGRKILSYSSSLEQEREILVEIVNTENFHPLKVLIMIFENQPVNI